MSYIVSKAFILFTDVKTKRITQFFVILLSKVLPCEKWVSPMPSEGETTASNSLIDSCLITEVAL